MNDRIPPRPPEHPGVPQIGNGHYVEQPTPVDDAASARAALFLLVALMFVVAWIGASIAVVLAPWSAAGTVGGLVAAWIVFGTAAAFSLGTALKS